MSVELMGLVFYLRLQAGPKLLLLALADNANDVGLAWPNQDTLAQKTSCDVRSVRRQTRLLEAQGWLDVIGEPSRGNSLRYLLNVEKIKADISAQKADKADIGAERRTFGTGKADIGDSAYKEGTIIEPPLLEPSLENPPISPLPEKTLKKVNKPLQSTLELPEWLDTRAWDAFVEMRNTHKPKPTPRALELIIHELAKLRLAGNDPNAVLGQSVMNGWKGVFAIKPGGSNNGNRDHQFGRRDEKVPGGKNKYQLEAERLGITIS